MPPSDKPLLETEEEIFHACVSLSLGERVAYLDLTCDGRPGVRSSVEQLCAAHDDHEFMHRQMDRSASVDCDAESNGKNLEVAGDLIGKYKLLEQIGEGGFGIVWLAEQEQPVQRRVALKIIKPGMDSTEVIRRFEQERQALAMMDHPNIAKVFDAGATEQGRPFLAMELVEGVPITRYCDENHLVIRDRLSLFEDVCSAINGAHQKGIIHRDIKPSNVMVAMQNGIAVIKVIDFGIAKATLGKLTEKTLFTSIEQFIGTPAYMSPEQASFGVDIDTRSDIYSLGVLLYELLTGSPPFDSKSLASAGYEEMRRIIRDVEPPRPSLRLRTFAGEERAVAARARQTAPEKLERVVEPDLDWIVMKAIEKDRSRRYETADRLSVDIRRFLSNETVSARPPSAGYRFQKFARRNKMALGVAMLVAAVLSAATSLSLWQAKVAIKAKKEATKRAEESDAIANFLTGVFQSPDPLHDGRSITVVEMLGRAAKELQADDSIDAERKAKMQAHLSTTYQALGLPNEGIPLQERVRDYLAATSGPEHPDTLNALHNLARLYADVGRQEEALAIRERVRTLLLRILGPEHPDTLHAIEDLSVSYFAVGRRQEAIEMLEGLIVIQRKLNGAEHPDVAMEMNNLAAFYGEMGRRKEALEMREQVLQLRLKSGEEHPNTLLAIGNLAISYAEVGRRDEAIKLMERMLTLSRKVFGPEHHYTLAAMVNLASFYTDGGRHNDAIGLEELAVEGFRKVDGPEHPSTLSALDGLGRSYFTAGRLGEAITLQEQLLQTSMRINGPEHRDTLRIQLNLADSYFGSNRRDEALNLRQIAHDGFLKLDGPEHPNTLTATSDLGESYFAAGRHEEALQLRIKVLETRRLVLGKGHPDTLHAIALLAESYDALGRNEEAKALRDEPTAPPPEPPAK